MRKCSQSYFKQKRSKRDQENALRRSRLGVLARERKRLANPIERELRLVRYYPLQFGVRDKHTGDIAWVDFKSVRDAARWLAVVQRFYR